MIKALVISAIILLVGFAQATTITVCPSGCNNKSIQDAVYAAKLNDTIEVQSGTYNESVFLTKELKFIGRGTGNTEPIVLGNLYKNGYMFSLKGFGFNSVQDYPDPSFVDRGTSDYWIGVANQHISAQSYTKALDAISKALVVDPQNAVALNTKGLIYSAQGRTDDAIEYLEKAIEIDKSFDAPWFNKGVILIGKLDYYNALNCFEKAIERDPRSDVNWYEKALTLVQLGKYDDALIAAENSTTLNPLNANNWAIRSNVLFVQRKYDEALNTINQSIDLSAPAAAADYWQQKGMIYQSMGGHKADADAAFATAMELRGAN